MPMMQHHQSVATEVGTELWWSAWGRNCPDYMILSYLVLRSTTMAKRDLFEDFSKLDDSPAKSAKKRHVDFNIDDFFDLIVDHVNSATHLPVQHQTLSVRVPFLPQEGIETRIERHHLITRKLCDNQSPGFSAELVIAPTGMATFRVDGVTLLCRPIFDVEDCSFNRAALDDLLKKFNVIYRRCSGMKEEEYKKEFSSHVRYEPKNLSRTTTPFPEIHGADCEKWFPSRVKQAKNCEKCRTFFKRLRQTKTREITKTHSMKKSRTATDSHFPKQLLSPKSRKKRETNIHEKSKSDNRKLKRLRAKMNALEIQLNDSQSEEMGKIVHHVASDSAAREALSETIFQSTRDPDERAEMRRIWDKDNDAFSLDQQRNVTGRKSNKWSMVTYRLALSVFIRSPAAYEALKSFKLLQLPSRQSLQSFTRAHFDGPGLNANYVSEQTKNYATFCKNEEQFGRLPPLGEGILIFDEVKVIGQVMWNTSSHELYGLALTAEQFTSLADLYAKDGKGKYTDKAHYMLQFLWRDLTSKFDVLGPYFPSAGPMDTNELSACLLNTMEFLEIYGFSTTVIVCDGASSNLATVKLLCTESSGAYRVNVDDDHSVKVWFENPFRPSYTVYFVICPTHQMKNMVNALYSSSPKPKRSKLFRKNRASTPFGWKAIEDMYDRECQKSASNLARRVDGLKKEYVVRDAWTKLNVVPAKIMQQEKVMSELISYAAPDFISPPPDAESVTETWKYLKACNKLFENGFLSSNQVTNSNTRIIDNIFEGFDYFKNWINELIQTDNTFNSIAPKERKFIAWQTWDLLRVCVFGFSAFCRDFLDRNPDYYVIPVRINGSAVETLFSQFKFITGSKLSSVNYASAVKAFKMKKLIHGTHAAARGYLDRPLYTQETVLKRVKSKR